MKKPILKLTTFCLAVSVLGTACKKESNTTFNQLPHNNQHSSSTKMRLAPTDLASTVEVSPYGFLVLNSRDYLDFIYDNNADDILKFQSSIGFASQVSVEGQADNLIPSSPENGEYMFNRDGIVQIGGIIIRGVNNDGYLLAMPAENLNEETYQKLALKSFDPHVMAKLRVGASYAPTDESDYDFEGFVRANIGHDGSNDPVSPTPGLKFWGWGKRGNHWYYYVFWIPVDKF